MALDTYTNLKAAVASWLSRSDQTTNIVDAITLAEAQMQRELRNRQMEQRATADSTEYIALPTDFWELRRIQINTASPHALAPMSPTMGTSLNSSSGEPRWYAIEDNQFRLIPAPDATYTVEIDYWKKIPVLSGSNATNWILTDHPDLYLTGAQAWVLMLLQDDERATRMGQVFTGLIAGINKADRVARWSGTPMRVMAG